MTIRSREIALRCAVSLPPHLLAHRHTDHRRTDQAELHGLPATAKRLPTDMLDQLMGCADDMAQRLILGTSK